MPRRSEARLLGTAEPGNKPFPNGCDVPKNDEIRVSMHASSTSQLNNSAENLPLALSLDGRAF